MTCRLIPVDDPGNCYRDAAHVVLDAEPAGAWVLVHGFPIIRAGPYAGRRYGHAWCETPDGAIAHDPSNGALCRRETFYRLGGIDARRVRRYEACEVREAILSTAHYGPWEADPYRGVLYAAGEPKSSHARKGATG